MVRTVKKYLSVAALAALALAAGCDDEKARVAYYNYLKTVEGAQKAERKLLEIIPIDGKPINVKSITVYQPDTGYVNRAPYIKPTYHPAWSIFGTALRIAGQVGTVVAAGNAARGLADTVGKSAGHNTTITGTASGTQSGVVVPTGPGATGASTPADSHDSDSHDSTSP